MSDRNKDLITALLQEYDIKTVDNIQGFFMDLIDGTIQNMPGSELNNHLSYETYERTDNTNSRNGKKSKSISRKYGEMEIDLTQDRDGSLNSRLSRNVRSTYQVSRTKSFLCVRRA